MAVIISIQASQSALTYRATQRFHNPPQFILSSVSTPAFLQPHVIRHGSVGRSHGAFVTAAPLIVLTLSIPGTGKFDNVLVSTAAGQIDLSHFSYQVSHTVRHGPPGRRMHGGGTIFAASLVAISPTVGLAESDNTLEADAVGSVSNYGQAECDSSLEANAAASAIEVSATARLDNQLVTSATAVGSLTVPGTGEFDAVLTATASGVPKVSGTAGETTALVASATATVTLLPTAAFSTALTETAISGSSVFGTAGGTGAFAFVQSTNFGSSVSPLTVTFTNPPVVGNLMLASVYKLAGTNIPVVSDTNGNWTLIASQQAVNCSVYLFGKLATAGQPQAVKVTFGGANFFMNIYELSGAPASLTGIAYSTGGFANLATTTTTSGLQPSINIAPNDLLFTSLGQGQIVGSNSASPAISEGSLLQSNPLTSGFQLVDAYVQESANGTDNPYFTFTGGHHASQMSTVLVPGGLPMAALTASAIGAVSVPGTAEFDATLIETAGGVSNAAVSGNANGVLTLVASAAGTTSFELGIASESATLDTLATGSVNMSGAASESLALTASAIGVAGISGNASEALNLATTAVGTVQIYTTVGNTTTLTTSGSGSVSVPAISTGFTTSLVSTGSAIVDVSSSTSTTAQLSATADGTWSYISMGTAPVPMALSTIAKGTAAAAPFTATLIAQAASDFAGTAAYGIATQDSAVTLIAFGTVVVFGLSEQSMRRVIEPAIDEDTIVK